MANTLKEKNNNSENIFQKSKNLEEYYRNILENTDDLISVYNKKLNIEYINKGALKKVLGYNFEDIEEEKSFKIISS